MDKIFLLWDNGTALPGYINRWTFVKVLYKVVIQSACEPGKIGFRLMINRGKLHSLVIGIRQNAFFGGY